MNSSIKVPIVESTPPHNKAKGNTFLAEKPRIWSQAVLGDTGIFNAFDMAPDGNRAIALIPADEPGSNKLVHVLLNVSSELYRIFSSHHG